MLRKLVENKKVIQWLQFIGIVFLMLLLGEAAILLIWRAFFVEVLGFKMISLLGAYGIEAMVILVIGVYLSLKERDE